jgi:hypothetical protein
MTDYAGKRRTSHPECRGWFSLLRFWWWDYRRRPLWMRLFDIAYYGLLYTLLIALIGCVLKGLGK